MGGIQTILRDVEKCPVHLLVVGILYEVVEDIIYLLNGATVFSSQCIAICQDDAVVVFQGVGLVDGFISSSCF